MAALGLTLVVYSFLHAAWRRWLRRPGRALDLTVVKRANEAHEAGRHEDALRLVESVLAGEPLNLAALLLRTRIQVQTSNVDAVAAQVETLLPRIESPCGLAVLLARAYLDGDRLRQAQRWWQIAEQDPHLDEFLELDRHPVELKMRLGRAGVSYV